MNLTQEQVESFWSRVDRSSECWVWRKLREYKKRKAGNIKNPYTYINIGGQHIGIHRIAYVLAHGAIPEGLYVCHHCDNPPCCNPAHLYAGTAKDNAQDAIRRGRVQKRERKPKAIRIPHPRNLKVTNEQVREMRAEYKAGYSLSQLANKYNVNPSFVSLIVNNKRRLISPEEHTQ